MEDNSDEELKKYEDDILRIMQSLADVLNAKFGHLYIAVKVNITLTIAANLVLNMMTYSIKADHQKKALEAFIMQLRMGVKEYQNEAKEEG